MKHFPRPLAVLLFLLINTLAVFAQAQKTEDEANAFTALEQKSDALLKQTPHRERTTTELYDAGTKTPKSTIVSVYETVTPDRSRYAVTFDSSGLVGRSETIRIGQKRYRRDASGNWQLDDSKIVTGGGGGAAEGATFVEKTTLDGRAVVVYDRKSFTADSGVDYDTATRYWFDEQKGRLLKKEARRRNQKTGELARIVTVYEYDPKITIEGPVIR
ncbi:MAG: hypothetical protein JSS81_19770 [Acidobacteria bacterium]|nr:hypothetical protein [Acidobacteriota bacterium]